MGSNSFTHRARVGSGTLTYGALKPGDMLAQHNEGSSARVFIVLM